MNYLAQNVIPDGDKYARAADRGARRYYTVHLNDDGTTCLYYTADLES